jgi:hypothetical protein
MLKTLAKSEQLSPLDVNVLNLKIIFYSCYIQAFCEISGDMTYVVVSCMKASSPLRVACTRY